MILPETEESGALALADRLRLAIKEAVHRSEDGQPFHVTAGLGVTWMPVGREYGGEELLATADQGLLTDLVRPTARGIRRTAIVGRPD